MKSFNQFVGESYTARENIMEALPLIIPAAMKLGSMALGAYSAYSAAKNLKKGNYKGAALDALGMVPGGAVFKGAKLLGAGKNVARAASATQSVVRNFSPNARNRAIGKGIDMATGALGLGGAATAKDTAPEAPKNNTVSNQGQSKGNTTGNKFVTLNPDGTYKQNYKGGKNAIGTAARAASRSNLGGNQTDGKYTAMAGKGAVPTGGGNSGNDGYVATTGAPKAKTEAPKGDTNTNVGTTTKKKSDQVKTKMDSTSKLTATNNRSPEQTKKIKSAITLS
tara:strand:+ start:655 stop:1494 length:840 start_codon:yes stop_codon:yes gene_type:complete